MSRHAPSRGYAPRHARLHAQLQKETPTTDGVPHVPAQPQCLGRERGTS